MVENESFQILLNPKSRLEHIKRSLLLRGVSHVDENSQLVYCPISLSTMPENVKNYVLARQRRLCEVLSEVGLSIHDPSPRLLSPDKYPSASNQRIYSYDVRKLAQARYFVGNLLLPSIGVGIELEAARDMNRFGVVIIDRNIRSFRMLPPGLIYLGIDNFDQEVDQFKDVFTLLKSYTPGLGYDGELVLLGFGQNGEVVDLNKEVENRFPNLVYQFDHTKPSLELDIKNPQLFSEFGFNVITS